MSRSGWVGGRSRRYSQSRSQNHWRTCLDECGIGLANCNRRCRVTRNVSHEIELSERRNNAEPSLSNDFDDGEANDEEPTLQHAVERPSERDALVRRFDKRDDAEV